MKRTRRRLNFKGKVFLSALLGVFVTCVLGFVAAPKLVTVKVDGSVVSVATHAMTIEGALEDAGVVLRKNDYFVMSNSGSLEEGSQIEIVRAMPLRIWKAGKETGYSVGRATVKAVLDSLDIDYKNCIVVPDLATRPQPDMLIGVFPQGSSLHTKRTEVPFASDYRRDDRIPEGQKEELVPGNNGYREVFYAVSDVAGRSVVSILREKIIEQPTNRVVLLGTGQNLLATSRGYVRYKQVKPMEATAYTLADGSGTGLTSTGLEPRHGIIAVDPAVIPYGTRVFVPGYGFAVAEDTGGEIEGDKIDLYMEHYQDAVTWGRRAVDLYILE